ncbi:K+-transporting ATPase ATPase C chain [Arcticibacter tournemirensis]|uniref:Potassium-transporting ATPase KdpC subunit n=1 Tax=Arcticibacter tournemirensis TaxID=699437 RepID=A0A5M9HFM1_9SPHI|nr:K(+)-transporting ATPase subunit C [Arcticibacter tournemirensis]KAA8485299.1 K(+)-transporting ATPase subunit C [Arcticibacter tournemirensis]TQM50417.1 K+-transporting ATPase ATPase C chain [Arcticibacter tournemirensis]
MKSYFLSAIRMTLVLLVLLCVIYPLTVAFIARFSPGKGNGETVTVNGKVVGYALVGQSFTAPQYFWGRPSAVSYNAAGSAGSNKGPTNPDYLQEVKNRIDTLVKYHPGLKKSDIPTDMVTASGSGLDPNISVEGAMMQVSRIAKNRNLKPEQVASLVAQATSGPLFGLLGPSRVNVLKLNVSLDRLNNN